MHKLSKENLDKLRAAKNMISLSRRVPDVLEAQLKVLGWSKNMRKMFGVGYNTIVISSTGQQWGNVEGRDSMDAFFSKRDISFALHYMTEMDKLNKDILADIDSSHEVNRIEKLSYLFTYFSVIRWVVENIYECASMHDKKLIDQWRNREGLFSSLVAHTKQANTTDPSSWSVVGMDDEVYITDEVITYEIPGTIQNNEIKGAIGYPGSVTGKAVVLRSGEPMPDLEEGDIIVAVMTTVDFLPIMGKAAAFVTDEGGITCHAAIVAREMKKPCIIGTRIASKVLETGDMIEVDATQGIVKIIQKHA